ncbi:MAG: cation-translocating P-type ATPase, partial [Chloroflexi bacterium]|nr:cation-translocating P-type ATPase [Chloroflexota bacterium]
ASTTITYGKGTGVVVETGMDTELGKIAGLVQSVEEGLTPLQQRLDQLGKWLVYACLLICAVVFAVGIWRDTSLSLLQTAGLPGYLGQYQHVVVELFITAVALAVAAIPEGLPAVVTIALALGVRRMVQRHALVRKLPSVETLGSAQVICSDKTGTLTQNEMTVRKVYISHRMINVAGAGYAPEGEFRYEGSGKTPSARVDRVLRLAGTIAGRCNNAVLKPPPADGTAWSIVGDPTEAALLTVAGKLDLWATDLQATYPFRAEIPFDAERKRMTLIATTSDTDDVWLPAENGHPSNGPAPAVALMKGAPEMVLARCGRVYDGREMRLLEDEERRGILTVNEDLAAQALRVLAVAYRQLPEAPEEDAVEPDEIERDMVFVALLAMIDPPRPEVKEAVYTCNQAGIAPVMITGDHLGTAQAIARELGILKGHERAISGAELDEIGRVKLESMVEDVRVYARVSAEHKLRIVRAWRDQGYVVAMTGDGVNDAPAVKEADIGIAMGITGTDVTKEASDMVLTDDNFASIVAAIEEGRAIFDNIRRFIHYLISCNIGEVLAMFFASLLGLPLPLLPIQILWINLATDSLPALALGVEPPEPDLMKRKPRPSSEGIINRAMAIQMALQGILIGGVTLGAFALEYYVLGNGDADRARVMAFSASILAQNLHAFNCRSRDYSIFQLGLFTNRALVGAFVLVVISELAIVYLPFFQPIFKTMPLTLNDWAVVVALGVIPLAVMETYKLTRLALRRLRGG